MHPAIQQSTGNQWVKGWNQGRYGKSPATDEVQLQNNDWQEGFVIGVQYREKDLLVKSAQRKKKLLALLGY